MISARLSTQNIIGIFPPMIFEKLSIFVSPIIDVLPMLTKNPHPTPKPRTSTYPGGNPKYLFREKPVSRRLNGAG